MTKKYRGATPHAKYLIDGRRYASMSQVFGVAKSLGYDGSRAGLHARLAHGESTWAGLARKVNAGQSSSARIRISRGRAELAEAIAALDARKGAMA